MNESPLTTLVLATLIGTQTILLNAWSNSLSGQYYYSEKLFQKWRNTELNIVFLVIELLGTKSIYQRFI